MGGHEGEPQWRADGSAWMRHALLWTIGGMLCFLFVVGCGATRVDGGSAGKGLESGLGLAGLGLVCGFWVWLPLWIVAVASGWLVLRRTFGFPPEKETLRRGLFAVGTAAGVGLSVFLVALWYSRNFHSLTPGFLVFWTPVIVIAGVSAWLYYPRERELVGLDEFQVVPKSPEGEEN